ncbi:MAG: hypothetical protein U9O78_03795 [Patescibacteria group bacterium]|nr:hypothetical protein [Patescibacteria group bacterium]
MITILHGENNIASRQKLVEIMNQAKKNGVVIKRLEAEKLEPPILEEQLVKSDLFGNQRLVVIEKLHSLRRSKKKKVLIKMVSQSQVDVCLWESRKLTKTMLKKISAQKVKLFKISGSIFDWLDSIGASNKEKQLKLLKQALIKNDEYMCFAMLARQIRLLIKAKDGGKVAGPPFVVRKIKRQANQFSFRQLLRIHQQLFEIDKRTKTSTNILTLKQRLQWLILNQ